MKKNLRSNFGSSVTKLKRYMDTMEYTPALTELINLKTSSENSSITNKKVYSDKKVEAPNLGYSLNLEESPMFI